MEFSPVDPDLDLPSVERQVLRYWQEHDVFGRSVRARDGRPRFIVYEGPPTANGAPGVHHVAARTFKDVFPRYQTMKGLQVPRQAGWDCHGIPVEVEVERALGFSSKQDIEDYGIAAFNEHCRRSVQGYVDDWVRLTQRIGYWLDLDHAYWTMDAGYVQSVWWSLSQLWDQGLLYEADKVVPYCPRCGTALSDHEVSQGYARVRDTAAYVLLPLADGPLADAPLADGPLAGVGAALVVWTTTPWTLVANAAVAIADGVRYVVATSPQLARPVVLAADAVERVLGPGAQVVREVSAGTLLGSRYHGPYAFDEPSGDVPPSWRAVVRAEFVTSSEGTGLVHLAPAFGADDLAVARREDLPVINPVTPDGKFDHSIAPWSGRAVREAVGAIVQDLDERGLLLRAEAYDHEYPLCWRCDTPLLYYAKPSWYIGTSTRRDDLLAENARVDWQPEGIRDGRYGNWLASNVDWALSRERYWGTPLPVWRCSGCDRTHCVASLAELGELAGADLGDMDPHRPYIDGVRWECDSCGGTLARVPEVIDAWYDSGAMPFARLGYPHRPGSDGELRRSLPADYVAEGLDQTRGWFYSTMAISVLILGQNAYRRAAVLGIAVDEHGKKMSKSRGNVVDAWEVIEACGADGLRWLLLSSTPWTDQRLSVPAVELAVRQVLRRLWNVFSFFVTYARIEAWIPSPAQAPRVADRPVLDRWILARLSETVRGVDGRLGSFDAYGACQLLAGFVDDLSNWYVRRSRRRFWGAAGVAGADQLAAFETLYECLTTLAQLMAPLTPFLAEELWLRLVRAVDGDAAVSVHLSEFPTAAGGADDPALRQAMVVARKVTELGRRARNEAGIGIRQPLRSAAVTLPAESRALWPLVAGLVAEELNVKDMPLAAGPAGSVRYALRPNFRSLGPRFGDRKEVVATAIRLADPAAVARALAERGQVDLRADGDAVTLTAEDVAVVEQPHAGWQTASDGAYSVALDLSLDADLRLEGLARELVRTVNELRKRQGLGVSDRIVLSVGAEGSAAEALRRHGDWVAGEVLASRLDVQPATRGERVELSDGAVTVELSRIPGEVGPAPSPRGRT